MRCGSLVSAVVVVFAVSVGLLFRATSGREGTRVREGHDRCADCTNALDVAQFGLEYRTVQLDGVPFEVLTNQDFAPGRETVVFVHGFPDSPVTFNRQMGGINKAGFNTLAPQLRGFSPAHHTLHNFTGSAAATDVVGILTHLGVQRAHVVCHDWGVAAGFGLAQLFPDHVVSLTIMAVPTLWRFFGEMPWNPSQLVHSWYMAVFQVPWLAEALLGDCRTITWLWNFAGRQPYSLDRLNHACEFARSPAITTALAWYRALPRQLLRYVSQTTPIAAPTLALHGKEDGAILESTFLSGMSHAEDYSSSLEVHVLDNAGHFLQHERPDTVTELILGHVQRHRAD